MLGLGKTASTAYKEFYLKKKRGTCVCENISCLHWAKVSFGKEFIV